jgi:D-beta-D-heptose 7-phosphate kinase/D-beta-D-heptose 1-phosphate adenosyltransferase
LAKARRRAPLLLRVINCYFNRRHSFSRLRLRGDSLNSAILTLEEAILRFGREKRNDPACAGLPARAGRRRIVFTNGCFDLLHPGHLRTLELARELGDVLIIGLNSDASVRQLKGPGRPVIPERERAEILAALESVDAVVIFDELTPREVISRLLPDVLVKGGDWPDDQIVGREEVEAAGGRVVSIPVVRGYSTSAILQRICEGARASRAKS